MRPCFAYSKSISLGLNTFLIEVSVTILISASLAYLRIGSSDAITIRQHAQVLCPVPRHRGLFA
ncbi:uncharacterized protein METZ01_LOCUS305121, partial [marine metagenome]